MTNFCCEFFTDFRISLALSNASDKLLPEERVHRKRESDPISFGVSRIRRELGAIFDRMTGFFETSFESRALDLGHREGEQERTSSDALDMLHWSFRGLDHQDANLKVEPDRT